MAKVYLHVGGCGSMLNYMHEYFIQAKIVSHTHSTHTHTRTIWEKMELHLGSSDSMWVKFSFTSTIE